MEVAEEVLVKTQVVVLVVLVVAVAIKEAEVEALLVKEILVHLVKVV